jgi:hypothetical protein
MRHAALLRWSGPMPNLLSEMWQEIQARPDGPFAFRFYLQPLVASLFALRDGIRDAKLGRPAYFWAIFADREHRSGLLHDGWRSVGKVFLFALALDVIYQLVVLKGIRPVEGLIVATLLAIVPYVFVRGPVTRIARRLPPWRALKTSRRP